MNREGLRLLRGRVVKLRPAVQRLLPSGLFLPSIDDDWFVEHAPPANGVVRVHNQATGHFVDLGTDNVYEFRGPDNLVLKEQLTLSGRDVLRDPLPDPRFRYTCPMLRSRVDERPTSLPAVTTGPSWGPVLAIGAVIGPLGLASTGSSPGGRSARRRRH